MNNPATRMEIKILRFLVFTSLPFAIKSIRCGNQSGGNSQLFIFLQIEQAIKLDKKKRLSGNRTTPDSLDPGIYTLDLDIIDDQRDLEQEAYTIYHVTSTVGAGDLKMHFGIAPAKLRFYFDQDNDGWVDTETIYEYMDSIPFVGRWLSKTAEPELSQELYDTFLTHSDKAKFITPERIKEDAEKAAQDLWSWATDTFEEISNGIME